jgi:hypothetical protein
MKAVTWHGRRDTISLSGVYGGAADPLPLVSGDDDPLRVESFATHRIPLDEAPGAYERFQKKHDGTFKVLLQP